MSRGKKSKYMKINKDIMKVVLLMIIVIFTALVIFTTEDNLIGKYDFFTVPSNSMNPAIKKGSIVISEAKNDRSVIPDDKIIVFKSPIQVNNGQYMNNIYVHRIVNSEYNEFGEIQYVTKGDNNNTIDPWLLDEDMVIGSVRKTIPYLGYFVDFIKTPFGFFVTIIIPCIYIIFSELVNLNSLVRKEKDNIVDYKKYFIR